MGITPSGTTRLLGAGFALTLIASCEGGLDLDLRGELGAGLDTTSAAQTATTKRPKPDDRGVISYPSYQVAVARRGDTLTDVANRVGVSAKELGVYNGIAIDAKLRQDEIVALPVRVPDSVPAAENVDIASLAGGAIDRAQPTTQTVQTEALETAPKASAVQTGAEPIQHKVKRGETAFTIARLYNVSVRALADWNGLGSDYTIRENQILLIPPTDPASATTTQTASAAATTAATTTQPGQGSPTPTPPSASKPLPKDSSATPAPTPNNDLGASQSTSKSAMSFPVNGKIVRPYSKGKNNGIDIAGKAGDPVQAAAAGSVAAITTDGDDVKILVVRHPDNLMTVYYNVEDVSVAKGAKVKRGQAMAKLPQDDSFVHFEVRKGFDSVDPMPYLN
jgi:murein DD-endopeptidase MepM/ murein hydrolase activator NlpD